ncbi:MAG: hypothetical protein K0V04_28285, partial [Deltaproteobacteria bacterium]|nr:hypothetical protein [Deltaproteobacteria bacterium]
MFRRISVALTVLLGAPGCPADLDAPEQGGSSSSGSSSSSDTASVPDVGNGDSTTSSGWPLPTDDDVLTCVRGCEGPWDCCPPKTAGLCPGPSYPYNFMCIEGLCVSPPCVTDEDCPGTGEQCLVVQSAPRCVLPCEADDSCMAVDSTLTCSGQTDDGDGYCFAHCDNPGVFCGNQTCDSPSGLCVCASA